MRSKLTIWYALVCGVTLALVGLGMVLALNYQIQASIDGSLRSTASTMSLKLSQLNQRPGPSSTPSNCGRVTHFYCQQIQEALNTYSGSVSKPGQFEQVQLHDPTARIRSLEPPEPLITSPFAPTVSGHPGIPMMTVQYETSVSQVASRQGPRYLDVTSPIDSITGRGLLLEHFRVYLVRMKVPPALAKDGVVAVLEVFQSRHDYLDIERNLYLILIASIPIGILLAMASGWWIAHAALRPINRISTSVRRIGESRDLGRRLNFVGPVDEVSRLADTFDGMMDRLEKVFDSQKRFIADASHELRTPLTAIRGNADLMTRAPVGEQGACLSAIRRESERMSRLVSDLLLLAEADVEDHPLQAHPIRLDRLLAEVHRSGVIIAGDETDVFLDAPQEVVVEGDPDRLRQLFLNLMDNAVKFTPEGGSIGLSLSVVGGEAVVEVSDTGVGIPKEEQEAIFQRFYRMEVSRSKRGSGLGLSICAWIVRAHGGQISVRSAPGKGSTFSVALPLVQTAKSQV